MEAHKFTRSNYFNDLTALLRNFFWLTTKIARSCDRSRRHCGDQCILINQNAIASYSD
jgi:hypothetical protein